MWREVAFRKPTIAVFVVCFLWLFWAQVVGSIPALSITFDEDMHITSGYSILRTGDLRLLEEHPALVKLWMAWPLIFHPYLPKPDQLPGWEEGDLNRFARNEEWWQVPIDSWTVPCRVMNALIGVLLLVVFFRWAREWFGPPAALGALLFLGFDPNILAHVGLATIDLGATCFTFLAIYTLQRYVYCPSRKYLVASGIALGLALSTKISALILVPLSAIILLGGMIYRRERVFSAMMSYMSVAFFTVWACHLFEIGTTEIGTTGVSIPVPLPHYWRAVLRVTRHVATGDMTYMLGELYRGGRWYFFPVVFVLKTPLPVLLLLGLGLIYIWRYGFSKAALVLSFPFTYFAFTMLTSINLGYRHILPVLPFLYLLIASLLGLICKGYRKAWLQASFVPLLIWQIIGTIRVGPFYLTYFNEIGGGASNGYRYLADSNVDWGQGLKALRSWLEKQGWPQVMVSAFPFFISPKLYQLDVIPLPPLAEAPPVLPSRFNPSPGLYVISASTLRGLHCADPEMYNWFWHREPDGIIANAMVVYNVSQNLQNLWVAQCTVPVEPLSIEALQEGLGHTAFRTVSFDCTRSWFYPADPPDGMYALHHRLLQENRCGLLRMARCDPVAVDPFVSRHLSTSHLVYEQRNYGTLPAFALYQKASLPSVPDNISSFPAPADRIPDPACDSPGRKGEVPLEGPLIFLGVTAVPDHSALDVETWWRVKDGPITRPLSIMGHLLTPTGEMLGVDDGLGVSPVMWSRGDIIVQRHHFSLSPAETKIWFRTGVYWLDTMERWPVADHPDADAIFIPLSPYLPLSP